MRYPIDRILERFEQKFIPEPNSGCWLWVGGTTRETQKGYGVFAHQTRTDFRPAHRVAYEIYRGLSVPKGLDLDHLCRVRSCVNPFHLEPVTRKENADRGLKGILSTHCKRGHLYTGERDSRGWRKCLPCGRIRKCPTAS
jgi:hypothetical protein